MPAFDLYPIEIYPAGWAGDKGPVARGVSPMPIVSVDLEFRTVLSLKGLVADAIHRQELDLRRRPETYNEEAHALAGMHLSRLREAEEAFRLVLYPTLAERFAMERADG